MAGYKTARRSREKLRKVKGEQDYEDGFGKGYFFRAGKVY